MDKNFVIAMVLMLAVFFAWQTFFGPTPPEPGTEATAPAEGLVPEGELAAVDKNAQTPEAATPIKESATPYPPGDVDLSALPATEDVPVEYISIDNSLRSATISNAGGVLTSLTLKDYKATAKPGSKDLEMVWTADTERYGFKTMFAGKGASLTGEEIFKVMEKTDTKVVLNHRTSQGLDITKTYEFPHDTYVINLKVEIQNVGQSPFQGETTTVTFAPAEAVSRGFFSAPKDVINQLSFIDDKLHTTQIFKVESEDVPGTQLIWSGFSSNYFLLAMAPDAPQTSKLKLRRVAETLVAADTIAFNKIFSPGERNEYNYTCYAGPKTEDALIAAGHNLDKSRDFGWFSSIARIMVRVLNFFNKYVHNYGISIIILTVIIKIVLLPLTQKSYTSMKSMQKLQPEMKEIREKFKDDREAMNQKTMELYRKHKVNPASGCLPMLVQLPIFIAFYRALYVSIELRHAPFFGWIQDLSAPDPYYITPIIMGATMLITQKMTPTSADPMQAKMMMAMPIVFTFLFLNFPAGLVVYWLVNNILTIFQQLYINKKVTDGEKVDEKPVKVGKPKKSK